MITNENSDDCIEAMDSVISNTSCELEGGDSIESLGSALSISGNININMNHFEAPKDEAALKSAQILEILQQDYQFDQDLIQPICLNFCKLIKEISRLKRHINKQSKFDSDTSTYMLAAGHTFAVDANKQIKNIKHV